VVFGFLSPLPHINAFLKLFPSVIIAFASCDKFIKEGLPEEPEELTLLRWREGVE